MEYPFVSVIIPTLRDREVLAKCVHSLLKQDYPSDKLEIILVSKKKLELDAGVFGNAVHSGKVKMISGVGFGEARNAGVGVAQGTFLAFVDDDAIVPPSWVTQTLSYFQNKKVAVVGGPALSFPDDTFHYRYGGYLFSSPFAVGFASVRYRRTSGVQEVGERNLLTANTVVKKEAFDAISGFDSRQVRSEDSDFYFRLNKKGYTLLYVPDTFVWHRAKPTFWPLITRVFYYAVGRAILLMRKPGMMQVVYFIPSLFILGLVTLALLSLFIQEFFYLLLGVLIFYAFANLVHTAYIFIKHERNPAGLLLVLVATPFIHFSYGLGILFGIYKHFTSGRVDAWTKT